MILQLASIIISLNHKAALSIYSNVMQRNRCALFRQDKMRFIINQITRITNWEERNSLVFNNFLWNNISHAFASVWRNSFHYSCCKLGWENLDLAMFCNFAKQSFLVDPHHHEAYHYKYDPNFLLQNISIISSYNLNFKSRILAASYFYIMFLYKLY